MKTVRYCSTRSATTGRTSRRAWLAIASAAAGALLSLGTNSSARADETTAPAMSSPVLDSVSFAEVSPDLTLNPDYLANTIDRRPLMRALDHFGLATPLDNAGIDIYGFLQGSYTVNLNDPHQDHALGPDPARHRIQGRMFDHHSNQLALNRFDVFLQRSVDYTSGKWDVGGLIEAQYGIDAAMMHSNGLFDYDWFGYESHADPAYQVDLTQAYVDIGIPVGRGLRVRAGKFTTLIGYESCDPTTRSSIQFYSRSWLLTLGIPMYQTGVVATYDFSDRLSANLGVTRGWDQSLEDNNSSLDLLGSVNYVLTDKVTLYGAFSWGPEQPGDSSHWRTLLNGVVYYQPSKTGPWTFALDSMIAFENNQISGDGGTDAFGVANSGFQHTRSNGNLYDQENDDTPVGETMWAGIAGYAAYRINPNLVAKGRIEYFYDADGTRWRVPSGNTNFQAAVMNDPFARVGRSYNAVEITGGLDIIPFPHDLRELLVRPEIRVDMADHDIFVNGDRSYQVTAAVDVIYKF